MEVTDMKITYFSTGNHAYTRLDDGRCTVSLLADRVHDTSYDVICDHRRKLLADLDRLQGRLALYNSALSTLELEAMESLGEYTNDKA